MTDAKQQPAFIVYAVTDKEGAEKSYWTRLGAAFEHRDGEGYSIILDALPVNGRLTLRKPDSSKS